MATEIFIEPELQELEQADAAAEWFEVCSELGLNNQLKHADRSEEKKAPPYMFIDPKTERIIRTICPRLVDYTEYSASTIPLDVLKEIQKASKNGWYKTIKIAYDDKSPDPFVIGVLHDQYDWRAQKHLIARWGAELLPLEQLEEKAITRICDASAAAISEMKYKMEYAASNMRMFAKGLLSGKESPQLDVKIGDLYQESSLPF